MNLEPQSAVTNKLVNAHGVSVSRRVEEEQEARENETPQPAPNLLESDEARQQADHPLGLPQPIPQHELHPNKKHTETFA